MKRKLLLTCIPALMLLGSCAGAQPEVKQAEFVEDTLLHEEIFGDVSSAFGKVKRNALPEDVDKSAPAIGVQRADNGSTYSIRFIAATNLGEGAVDEGKAVWTRSMYRANGSNYKAEKEMPSSVAYTTLRDGSGVPYAIEQFNTIYGTHYDSFVVYTMLYIPKGDYDDFYLNAYLTIDGNTEDEKVSNVLATNIAGTKRVSFAPSYTGFFLKGTILGNANTVLPSESEYKQSVSDLAAFNSEFAENDTFVIVNNVPDDTFFIYDSTVLTEIVDPITDDFVNSDGKIKVKYSAGYTLVLNSNAKLLRTDRWVPGNSVWLCRDEVWRKVGSLISNPSSEGELMSLNVELQEGDAFYVNTSSSCIKTITGGTNYQSNFSGYDDEDSDITVVNSGHYNFYIYEELTKLDINPTPSYSIIGGIGEENWDVDHQMSLNSNIASVTLTLSRGDTFKIRENNSWTKSYDAGALAIQDENVRTAFSGKSKENIFVEHGGTYTIMFNINTNKIDATGTPLVTTHIYIGSSTNIEWFNNTNSPLIVGKVTASDDSISYVVARFENFYNNSKHGDGTGIHYTVEASALPKNIKLFRCDPSVVTKESLSTFDEETGVWNFTTNGSVGGDTSSNWCDVGIA